jgi:methylamine---glutamate N-methyltransferase subunit B
MNTATITPPASTREEVVIDLQGGSVRELNSALHAVNEGSPRLWRVLNPQGAHAVAAGVDAPLAIEIEGDVGYYCAGMNKHAAVRIHGSAGVGLGENMMSGRIEVLGNASQAAAATAHGGLLHVRGNASGRCGISMKGVDIVVEGHIGPMSAFMAQAGTLTVLGDAGEALGDSLYEALIFVRGSVKSLGADCVEKPLDDALRAILHARLEQVGLAQQVDVNEFRHYGSARTLYHFHVDNAGSY